MKTFHIRPFGITIEIRVCGDAVVASISDEGLGLLEEASESRSVILGSRSAMRSVLPSCHGVGTGFAIGFGSAWRWWWWCDGRELE